MDIYHQLYKRFVKRLESLKGFMRNTLRKTNQNEFSIKKKIKIKVVNYMLNEML